MSLYQLEFSSFVFFGPCMVTLHVTETQSGEVMPYSTLVSPNLTEVSSNPSKGKEGRKGRNGGKGKEEPSHGHRGSE